MPSMTLSGSLSKNSAFFDSPAARSSAIGVMTRALVLAGQTSAQEPHPTQSSM